MLISHNCHNMCTDHKTSAFSSFFFIIIFFLSKQNIKEGNKFFTTKKSKKKKKKRNSQRVSVHVKQIMPQTFRDKCEGNSINI